MSAGVLSKKALKGLKPEVFTLAAERVTSEDCRKNQMSHYSCVAVRRATEILGIHPSSRHRYAREYGRVFRYGRGFDKAPWWDADYSAHNQRQRRDALLMMAAIVEEANK